MRDLRTGSANKSDRMCDACVDAAYAGAGPGSGRSHRKMISRHSSRSLTMSKVQVERGRLLELCLSVLGCSAQWHLQLLANRSVPLRGSRSCRVLSKLCTPGLA
jgi:hypothetical protein